MPLCLPEETQDVPVLVREVADSGQNSSGHRWSSVALWARVSYILSWPLCFLGAEGVGV